MRGGSGKPRSPSATSRGNAAAHDVRRAPGSAQRGSGVVAAAVKPRRKLTAQRRSPTASTPKKKKRSPTRDTFRRVASPERANRGAVKRAGSAARSKSTIRIAVDVAVARLQQWFREMSVRGVLRRRGLLASRIAEVLHREEQLRELRIRMAKRVLSEAFNNYAFVLHGGCEWRRTQHEKNAVTLVNAFMRTLADFRLRAQRLEKIHKASVRVIEKAWVRSALFQYLQRFSMEHKMQRLLLQQENIERRDYIRQRIIFLIFCHQECYNHPVLMEAGAAVRKLGMRERVIMDGSASTVAETAPGNKLNNNDHKDLALAVMDGNDSDSNNNDNAPAPSKYQGSLLVHPHYSKTSSLHATLHFMGRAIPPRGMTEMGEKVIEDSTARVSNEPPVRHRFYIPADTAFVHGLLQEMGQLEFSASMGARPRGFQSSQNFPNNVISTMCKARVQNTEHASDLVESRFVLVGGVILRESLRSFSLFKEFSIWTKAKETEGHLNEQIKLHSTASDDASNARFLHPVTRRKLLGKNSLSPDDYSVSATTMGKAWLEFYLAMRRNMSSIMNLDTPKSSAFSSATSSFSSSSSGSLVLEKRSKGYFSSRTGDRVSFKYLVGKEAASQKKFCNSPRFISVDGPLMNSLPVAVLGSEFDITYEIERLFIREYHRRLKLEEEYNAEIIALEWIIQRDKVNSGNGEGARKRGKADI